MKVIPLIFSITSGAHTHACSRSDTQTVSAICAEFANNYCITFNYAKSMSIKFGNQLSDCEKVKLQGNEIPWVDQIRHLGNFLNTSLNDKIDCRMKIFF